MPTLADGGYAGAGIGVHVPVKDPPRNQRLDPDTKTRNSLLRGLRSQGERGFALLSQRWTALQRITSSPRRTTEIVQAALVLTQFEHKYNRSLSLRSLQYSPAPGERRAAESPRGVLRLAVQSRSARSGSRAYGAYGA